MGRWSSGRKRDVVLRILCGETLDALGRELTVSPAKPAQLRDDFFAGGQRVIQVRNPDQRDGCQSRQAFAVEHCGVA